VKTKEWTCHDWEEYRTCLMTLSDDRLLSLKIWLQRETNEKERDTKVLYIDLEIERREKLRRYYENHIY
jgi:hypothetical protein